MIMNVFCDQTIIFCYISVAIRPKFVANALQNLFLTDLDLRINVKIKIIRNVNKNKNSFT